MNLFGKKVQMKILLANKFFFVNGGSETVYFQEREFLKNSGAEVVDFSMTDPRNFPSAQAADFVGATTYRAGGKLAKLQAAVGLLHSPEAVRNITALIERERPDILHCHNIYHQLTPSIIRAAHRLGVKTVLTLHDYKVICPTYTRQRPEGPCSECIKGDFSKVLRHRCSDGSLGRSALLFAEAKLHQWLGSYDVLDHVIAPSRFMLDSVTQWRFSPEKASLNYNGIDPAAFRFSAEDDGYVLFLGRLSAEKGLLTLGKAQALSGVPVKIAGTGPLLERLKSDYPGLELLGYQSGEPLRQLIARAAAVVVPSEWYENCPMSVLEAMACGKPVIGSRMGGIPELVEDGVTGRLFESGNAEQLATVMRELLGSPDLRSSMGVKARAAVEQRFSLEQHNARLLALYEFLLSH